MKKIKIFLSIFAALSLFLMACEPKVDSGLELGPMPTADQLNFTVTPGSDAYHWILTNTSTVTGIAYWDFGNGKKASGNVVEVHYPDVDTYSIKLTLVTSGGSISKTGEHTQDVPDPVAGNLVKGGKFLTEEDSAQWTIQMINAPNAYWQMHGGWAFIDNDPWSWGQAAIYQAIDVVAGQNYKIDLYFSSTPVMGGWFKIYTCLTEPVQGVEYTVSTDLVTEVGIWDWPAPAKSGNLSEIYNPDAGSGGVTVSWDQDRTIYLLIQCGANDLGDGVSVTNVEFRGYTP